MRLLFIFLILLIGCTDEVVKINLKSSAFDNNGIIPSKYTCQGLDVSPPFEIENIPEGAKSLVLVIDDPDAPGKTWDHWVMWNIPLVKEIEEDHVPGVQGLNDFGQHKYGGPCPPSGKHRYMFKLYALDVMLDISEDSKKIDVEKAMEDHILDQALLVGLFEKK